MGETAGVDEMALWSDFESHTVADRYWMGQLVRSEGRCAWFETELQGRKLILSVTETLNDEDALLGRLRATQQVTHPNLMAIEESGTATIEDTPLVFAAMEYVEENLDDVLRERNLSMDEAKQVLASVVPALAALHARGLVHSKVEAASVVASGDLIKLRTDCVLIKENAPPTAAADDLRGLGRLLTRCFTRRVPSGENDPALQLLPAPFAQIVRKCLSGSATIQEISAISQTGAGAATVPSPTPAPGAPKPAAPTQANATQRTAQSVEGVKAAAPAKPRFEDTQAAAKPPLSKAASPAGVASASTIPVSGSTTRASVPAKSEPSTPQQPLPFREDVEDHDERARHKYAPYLIGALAVLFLVTVLVIHSFSHHGAKPQAPVPAPSAAAAVPTPTVPRSAAPAHSGIAPVATQVPGAPTGDWHVIAFTYRKQDQAQHKAEQVNQRHPQLNAQVFTSARKPNTYLVALGGAMTRMEAFKLRAEALRLGMPRDTYARNFPQ